MASRVKLIHGLLAPLRPTTTYVHGSGSLTRFHTPLCSKEHVELIPSVFVNQSGADIYSLRFRTLNVAAKNWRIKANMLSFGHHREVLDHRFDSIRSSGSGKT